MQNTSTSYNEIIFKCPECDIDVIELTKTFYIPTISYELEVPTKIAEQIKGNTVYCSHCGDRFTIQVDSEVPLNFAEHVTIPMFLRH